MRGVKIEVEGRGGVGRRCEGEEVAKDTISSVVETVKKIVIFLVN